MAVPRKIGGSSLHNFLYFLRHDVSVNDHKAATQRHRRMNSNREKKGRAAAIFKWLSQEKRREMLHNFFFLSSCYIRVTGSQGSDTVTWTIKQDKHNINKELEKMQKKEIKKGSAAQFSIIFYIRATHAYSITRLQK